MRRLVASALVMTCALAAPSVGKFGIGFHWGFVDNTLRMDNMHGESLEFIQFQLSTIEQFDSGNFDLSQLPPEIQAQTTIGGEDIPLYVDRNDWHRGVLNLGGKIFVDIIPVIDAIEISANFGMWEYYGQVRYPNGVDPTALASARSVADIFLYDSVAITLDNMEMGYGPLHDTPYAKLHFDLTIRKYVVRIPKRLKVFRISLGAGASAHFATPVLSTGLIDDALGTELQVSGFDELVNVLNSPENQEKILQEIVNKLMTPHFGMHLIAGVMIKIPVVPFGIYADGKFMVPFGAIDSNVDLGGFGLLLNGGLTLTF